MNCPTLNCVPSNLYCNVPMPSCWNTCWVTVYLSIVPCPMSSAKSVSLRHIELRPSRRLLVLLTCLYLGAIVSVLLPSWSLPAKIILACIVTLSYPVSLNRIGWFDAFNLRYPVLFRPAVTGLGWSENGGWELFMGVAVSDHHLVADRSRECRPGIAARLLPATSVHPFMTVLNFYCEPQAWSRRRVALVLMADSLSAEDFRQLRVHLRTQPLMPVDSAVE